MYIDKLIKEMEIKGNKVDVKRKDILKQDNYKQFASRERKKHS